MGHPDEIDLASTELLFKRNFRAQALRAGALGSLFLDAEAGELLVELRHLPTRINDPVLAGPGRMRLGIDVQPQRVTFRPVAGARLELRAVGHYDRDLVIFGVDAGFHCILLSHPPPGEPSRAL